VAWYHLEPETAALFLTLHRHRKPNSSHIENQLAGRTMKTVLTPLRGLLLALALCVAPQLVAKPSLDAWHSSLADALAEAREHDKYILVDLYAEWCGWCHKLEKQVFFTPQFLDYANDEYVFLRVDTDDGGEGSMLQARYGASSLPTTLILDSDMVRVGTISGYAPLPRFIAHLEEQVGSWQTLLGFHPKVRDSDDVELQRKLALDLHERGAGRLAAELYERLLEQVEKGTDFAAWLHYQAADAYRLGHEAGPARKHLAHSRAMAVALADASLVERLDFLSFHIAQDDGDCSAATNSLKQFLENHPQSTQSGFARRALDAIKKGEAMKCT
jgi:thioredoxin-related protein